VGHHWLGLDDNNSGTLGSQGGGELLSELFGGVCMYRSASESGWLHKHKPVLDLPLIIKRVDV
jgi:hypothetical protein